MDDRTAILVTILANSDAVWLPSRTWNRPRPVNVYLARVAYQKTGVPWASGETSEAGRKATQRALEALAGERCVLVYRPQRVKTLSVKLTWQSDESTRALCGLPGMDSAWHSIRELLHHGSHAWVSERVLIGDLPPDKYAAQEAALVETLVLPALVRSFVESNADARGGVFYRVTDAGARWVNQTAEPPDSSVAAADAEAAKLCGEQLQAATLRLDTAAPAEPREIGLMPLPVSGPRVRLA